MGTLFGLIKKAELSTFSSECSIKRALSSEISGLISATKKGALVEILTYLLLTIANVGLR